MQEKAASQPLSEPAADRGPGLRSGCGHREPRRLAAASRRLASYRPAQLRVPATLLIAAGGFVPSVTTGLDRFGVTWSLFLASCWAFVLIFVGFLVSEEVFKDLRLVRPAGSASAKGTL